MRHAWYKHFISLSLSLFPSLSLYLFIFYLFIFVFLIYWRMWCDCCALISNVHWSVTQRKGERTSDQIHSATRRQTRPSSFHIVLRCTYVWSRLPKTQLRRFSQPPPRHLLNLPPKSVIIIILRGAILIFDSLVDCSASCCRC